MGGSNVSRMPISAPTIDINGVKLVSNENDIQVVDAASNLRKLVCEQIQIGNGLNALNIARDDNTKSIAFTNASGEAINVGTGSTGPLISEEEWYQVQNSLVQAPAITGALAVKHVFTGVGSAHSALVQDGLLYTCGDNSSGQLGHGDTSANYTPPTLVPGLSNVVSAACGHAFTVALTATGDVYGMGVNLNGQLGVNPATRSAMSNPERIASLSNVVSVACGRDFALFAQADGSVVGLGNNTRGQLGDDGTTTVSVNTTPVVMAMPAAPAGSSAQAAAGYKPSQLTCGASHTCMVLENGSAYLCGDNSSNQLGVPASSAPYALSPTLLLGDRSFSRGVCGTHHTVMATTNGDVYAFGANAHAQLGAGDALPRSEPVLVFSHSNLTTSNVAYTANIGAQYSLAAGEMHTVLGTNFGSNQMTYAWGANADGQLGVGTKDAGPFTRPTLVEGCRAAEVACGQRHTVVLTSGSNTFMAFGATSSGQTGDAQVPPGQSNRPFPNLVSVSTIPSRPRLAQGCYADTTAFSGADGVAFLCGKGANAFVGFEHASAASFNSKLLPVSTFDQSIQSMSSGTRHMAAVDTLGRLYVWGKNGTGQLGNGVTMDVYTPVLINGFGELGTAARVSAVACGEDFTVALDSEGAVYAWGNVADYGVIGSKNEPVLLPTKITGKAFGLAPGVQATAIACGQRHVAIVDKDGLVYTWGDNTSGQLGLGHSNPTVGVSLVSSGSLASVGAAPTALVACGGSFTLALDVLGRVHAWGKNAVGQLGDGSITDRSVPVMVDRTSAKSSLFSATVVAVACGDQHCAALDSDGALHLWGGNGSGQLGDGTRAQRLRAVRASARPGASSLSGMALLGVSCGRLHTMAVDADGAVHAWGDNSDGQVGIESAALATYPSKVTTSVTSVTPRLLSKGYGLHKIVRGDGKHMPDTTIQTAGDNLYGQLGDGSTTYRFSGAFSLGCTFPYSVVAAANSMSHSAVVLSNGGVYAWGRNTYFECGNSAGGFVSSASRGLVSTLFSRFKAVDVACGTGITLVLTSTGDVLAMGTNLTGMMGTDASIGADTQASGPVTITALSNVTAIAAGENHACALDAEGRLWVWGSNKFGQLGVAGTANVLAPIRLPLAATNNARVKDVAVGFGHTLILTADNTCMAAGLNCFGQLGRAGNVGRANANSSFSVVEFAGVSASPVSVACGQHHSVVLLANGTVRCFGNNDRGQLGSPAATQVTYPPGPMTASTTAISGRAFGDGVYTATASSVNSAGSEAFLAFAGTTTSNGWASATSKYNSSSPFGYVGATSTSGVTGEYLQLQLPTSQTITRVSVQAKLASAPKVIHVFGSSNGTTWTSIATASSLVGLLGYWAEAATVTSTVYVDIAAPGDYTHYRVVFNQLSGYADAGAVTVYRLGLHTVDNTPLMYPQASVEGSATISNRPYGNGSYQTTVSTGNGNGLFLVQPSYQWTATGVYNTSTPYEYRGAVTTVADGVSYAGDYVQHRVPFAVTLTKFTMTPFNGTSTRPGVFHLLGSTTGTTWTLLGSYTANGSGLFTVGINTYCVVPSDAFTHFRFVFTHLSGNGGLLQLSNIALYTGAACSFVPVQPPARNVRGISASAFTTYVETMLPREMVTYDTNGSSQVTVPSKVRGYGAIEWASGENVPAQAAGCEASALVTKAGALHSWGRNITGQIGNGSTTNATVPVRITGSFGTLNATSQTSLCAVAFGASHTVALDTTGKVHAWGATALGQVGNNQSGASANVTTPSMINANGSLAVVCVTSIGCGNDFSLALDTGGRVHAWGDNTNGQLGNNQSTGSSPAFLSAVPIIMSSFGSLVGCTVAAVACGASHAVAVDTLGRVHAWGRNNASQLGNGTTTSSLLPVLVSALGSLGSSGTPVVAVACGGDYTVVLDADGRVHAWGDNTNGQLGNNGDVAGMPQLTSQHGSLKHGVRIVAIACGYDHTLALDAAGTVHGWGNGQFGQLFSLNAPTTPVVVPVQMGVMAAAIACGYQHSILVDDLGQVFTVGLNSQGQLGNGTLINNRLPFQVSGAVTGSLSGTTGAASGSLFWNFTGQHRCFVHGYTSATLRGIEGLVVCANRNQYITTTSVNGDRDFLTGAQAITTNDALPVLSLCIKSKDKTVFGVVSLNSTTPATKPVDPARLLEYGDQRADVNSVGEGGVWVCDAHGPIESGEYITTSNVPGYGQKQDEPYVCNYTVGKSTMDCDFNPPMIPVMRLQKDHNRNNVLSSTDGMPVYVPVIDADGAPVEEPAYTVRYLRANGTLITEEEYAGSSEPVFRAAFIGCTYHCG